MWRVVYPLILHYVLLTLGVNLLYWVILMVKGASEDFYDWSVWVNGWTSLFILPVFWWLYQRDWMLRGRWRRSGKLSVKDGVFSFLWGGSLAIILNIVFALLQIFQRFPTYGEQNQRITGNVSVLWMVIWAAVAAPLGEELVCRGLVFRRLRDYLGKWPAIVISGVMFGIYHGNVVQAIYASILGILMAILVEMTGTLWASILFHMGANMISILYSSYAVQMAGWNDGMILAAFLALQFFLFWGGSFHFLNMWRKTKAVL